MNFFRDNCKYEWHLEKSSNCFEINVCQIHNKIESLKNYLLCYNAFENSMLIIAYKHEEDNR